MSVSVFGLSLSLSLCCSLVPESGSSLALWLWKRASVEHPLGVYKKQNLSSPCSLSGRLSFAIPTLPLQRNDGRAGNEEAEQAERERERETGEEHFDPSLSLAPSLPSSSSSPLSLSLDSLAFPLWKRASVEHVLKVYKKQHLSLLPLVLFFFFWPPLSSFSFPSSKGRGKREEAKETDSDGLRVQIASAKRNPGRRRRWQERRGERWRRGERKEEDTTHTHTRHHHQHDGEDEEEVSEGSGSGSGGELLSFS